jgi:SPP1 family predicted phage head-tail adaptor
MTGVRIGDLRQRVRLEAATSTPDGGGGVSESWALVAELWAAVRPLAGQERAEADAIAGRVTHEVFIRYRTGVMPAMRFVLGTRIFDSRAALDIDERQRWLRCLVEERVP